ncbi:hypothetical protein D4R52_00715 [bacterium]|nr:MAG: hypothetical protein D4R52_00715 [bacterium]
MSEKPKYRPTELEQRSEGTHADMRDVATRELHGTLFGKGKDVPPTFETSILLWNTGDEGISDDAYERFKNSDCIAVVGGEVQDDDYAALLDVGGENCRGFIMEAKGITSHGANLARESIKRGMDRENRYNKVVIGEVEEATKKLHDREKIRIDLSNPYKVVISVIKEK